MDMKDVTKDNFPQSDDKTPECPVCEDGTRMNLIAKGYLFCPQCCWKLRQNDIIERKEIGR